MDSREFDDFLSTLGDSFCHICKWNTNHQLVKRKDPNSGEGEINRLLNLKSCISPDTIIQFFKSDEFFNNLSSTFDYWLENKHSVKLDCIITLLFNGILNAPTTPVNNTSHSTYLLQWQHEILPCLKYISTNEYFVRHGLETKTTCTEDSRFPPAGTCATFNKNAFPIQFGRLDIAEVQSKRKYSEILGQCIYHGGQKWDEMVGVIGLEDFYNLGGRFCHGKNGHEHNHLFAVANIPLKYWYFIINESTKFCNVSRPRIHRNTLNLFNGVISVMKNRLIQCAMMED